jgi:Polyketide cyclase / dehydrase and lipid transport
MAVMPARTVGVAIERDPDTVYQYVSNPCHLPDWAPGLAKSVREEDGNWIVETAGGEVRITFVPPNDFRIADHRVSADGGLDVINPVRVLPNGDGAEVLFTVFQLEGMADEQFQRDVATVESDLQTLKGRLEGGAQP